MFRVLITDGMEETALQQLRQLGFEVTEQSVPAGELGAVMSQYDALLVRSATKVRSCHIEEARGSRLKLILRCGVGVDNIDVAAAEAAGIAVRNTPKAASESVAELALGHLLSCCRSISAAGHTMREDKWEKKAYAGGIELWGKTLGIIGFGRIGLAVAAIAAALGMHVLAYSRTPKNSPLAKFVTMDELLTQSDILTLHCPLTPQTTALINSNTLSKMKDGAILLNTSRGGVLDEQAVADALRSGKLKAAAVDVAAAEPIPADSPLLDAPNCIITPHMAWAPKESRQRILNTTAESIRSFLAGNTANTVN